MLKVKQLKLLQGRRSPSGAAKTLLRVAERHPEILLETYDQQF